MVVEVAEGTAAAVATEVAVLRSPAGTRTLAPTAEQDNQLRSQVAQASSSAEGSPVAFPEEVARGPADTRTIGLGRLHMPEPHQAAAVGIAASNCYLNH